ncbi:MAG: glycosyltransferase [Lutibacter sp.]
MIPKIIHYCWFGRNEKSDFIKRCISSWKYYLSDYELVEWNEDNFDIELNIFVKEAYKNKKWAFVSDYVRAYALFHLGGVYLDTDVEIKQCLDVFLNHDAFSGFEGYGSPFTALWGAKKGHNWPKCILEYYDNLKGFDDRTNTKIVTDFLVNFYKVDPFNNQLQKLEDGIYIYPSNYFCLNIEHNYAIHHFQGSWLDDNSNNNNSQLLKTFYKTKFLSYYNKDQIINNLYNDKLFSIKDLIIFILKRVKIKYIFETRRIISIGRHLISFLQFYLFELRKIKKVEVIFFFPFYHVGGAEQVHLNIVKTLKNKKSCTFFTGKSSSNKFLVEFKKATNTLQINKFINFNNIDVKKYLTKYIIDSINNKKNITVFGCNSPYFYEILPYIDKSIKKIDLIHAFSTPDHGIEQISISKVKYLDYRIVINTKTRLDLLEQYKKNNIEASFGERIIKIENAVEIKNQELISKNNDKIKIGFVGRWSIEKRPELFLAIAKNILANTSNVEFIMIGSDMEKYKAKIESAGVKLIGEITDNEILQNLYKSMNILLVTSYREGFPMVIMESMIHGVIPISTDVGSISEHIINNENGILIKDTGDFNMLISNFTETIMMLIKNKEQLNKLSENAFTYANINFGIQKFNYNYFNLLLNEK